MTIRPFPELRALAEAEALAHHEAWERAVSARPGSSFYNQEIIATRRMLGRDAETEAHLSILCDLTRPASRDAVCRLVAGRLVIPTAGGVVLRYHYCNGWKPEPECQGWVIQGWYGEGDDRNFGRRETGVAWLFHRTYFAPRPDTFILGTTDMGTDWMANDNPPIHDALAAIVHHLWPESKP